jgi:hypothetical protein
MVDFKKLIFGDPKQKVKEKARKKALEFERKEAYQQSYEKGIITRARKEGFAKGSKPQSRLRSTMNALSQISETSKQVENYLMNDMPGWGLPGQQTRKKKAKTRKGKTITIHVK